MDPIGAINYAKDSTLAMLLAAQARGFALIYLEQHDLSCVTGWPWGARPLTVRRGPGKTGSPWGSAGRSRWVRLSCILMRKDPPFDMEFIYSSYILDRGRGARRAGR